MSGVACTGINRKGEPCKATVMRGTDPPVCHRHSMSDEAWAEQAKRGGVNRWRQQRAKDAREDLEDWAVKQRAVEEIARLLDMTLPGTVEPNYEARAFGLLILATLFKLDRAELIELLKEVRPKLARDPAAYRMLDVEGAKKRLLAAYEGGRIDRQDLPTGVLG